MSVSCEGYIGYTVTLKEKLSSADFDFFTDFSIKHREYSRYDHAGGKEKVRLVVDGMNGQFARLIFVDEHIEDWWAIDKSYFPLKTSPVPDDVYDEHNKAYKLMYGKDLDKSSTEYAFWLFFL